MTEASRARRNGGISPTPASSPRTRQRTAMPLFEEALTARGIQAFAVLCEQLPGRCMVRAVCLRTGLGGSRRSLARRPCPFRLQAPPDRRPPRNPARRHADRREPTRRHPAPAAAGRRPIDPRSAGTPSPQAPAPVRGPGYDFDKYRRLLWKRGIKPLIARRGVAHGSGLGKVRWVVERAFAWLHRFKRLRIRYERRADLHQGLLELACSLICLRRLRTSPEAISWLR